MEKLPPEIALEIFYRLSPESVVLCKFVCKSWRNLLPRGDDGNYFANMHLRRRRHHQRNLDYSTLNFISLHEFRDEVAGSVVGEFHITEYDQVEGLDCKVKRLTLSQISTSGSVVRSIERLVGSCNGLVCFTITYRERERRGTTCLKARKIVICNPLLHEYVTLPLSDLQFKYCPTMVVTGFGHNPITGEYKVVKVYYSHSCNVGDVEVYTLGKSSSSSSNDSAGMWRSKGFIKYWLRSGSRPVLINGSLHWLTKTESDQNIVSFDLEDEEFQGIPLPSYPHITNNSRIMSCVELKELGGCLCLIEEIGDQVDWLFLPQKDLDIWVLKDYMNKESWVKEFSIKGEEDHWFYSPCAIKKKKKKKNGDGDEILLWCKSDRNTKRLVSYDSKTRSFKEVGRQVVVTESIFDPVLHINSLVSVKALGKVDARAENHHKTKT